MKVLSDILHKAGILKEAAEAYSSGGYAVLVRNTTTQRFETLASSAVTNIYTDNGTLTGNRTLNTGGFDLIFTGTDTASAGTARFIQMTPTLVASANSDSLIGLDVNPTFSVESYTSVGRWGTRTRSLWINHDTWNGVNVTPALYIGDTTAAAFYVQPGIASSGGTTELFMRGNNPGLGLWYFTLQADYNVTFNAGPYVENMYFNMGGSTAMIIKGTRNVLIGGTSDTGLYKLDVQGTGRFTNTLSVITTGITNEVALFRSIEPVITIEAAGGSNSASIFLKPSNSSKNATIQNRAGGGIEFYTGATPSLSATITALNNLLVGTGTDSGKRLQVAGEVSIDSGNATSLELYNTSTNNHLLLGNSGSTSVYGIKYSGNDLAISKTTGAVNITLKSTSGDVVFGNTIKTASPTGYAAKPYKLGEVLSGTMTPTSYIVVEIDGNIYSIPCIPGTP